MKHFFLVFVFLSVFLSHAQLRTTFEKGWIFKDQLKQSGYIRSDDLSMRSTRVCFKQNLEDQKCEIYGTSQVSSFQVMNGEVFDLVHVAVDNNRKETALFACLIFKGEKLSLYKSVYNTDIFYVLSKDGEHYALQNDKLISGEMEIRKYNYHGVLNHVTEGVAYRSHKKMKFDDDYFVEIVSEYNTFKGADGQDLRVEKKSDNFLMFNAGLGVEGGGSSYYGQVLYRKYIPHLSRKISMNFGMSYYNHQFQERNKNVKRSLLSIPVKFQHNFFQGSTRPYVFAGFSFNYFDTSEKYNHSFSRKRLERKYGLDVLYGAGIEVSVFKQMYMKVEYRREAYVHPLLFGIGWIMKVR